MNRMTAIRVRCQKPGCEERTFLAISDLREIGEEASIVGVDASGWVMSMMVVIDGWGFGLDERGVLYAVCPADSAVYEAKKGPPGSGA